mgnify:CR=1 FL=1
MFSVKYVYVGTVFCITETTQWIGPPMSSLFVPARKAVRFRYQKSDLEDIYEKHR